jgi:hypothetical protein
LHDLAPLRANPIEKFPDAARGRHVKRECLVVGRLALSRALRLARGVDSVLQFSANGLRDLDAPGDLFLALV